MGEFHTSFQHLIDHPGEILFLNYMRMSYQSYLHGFERPDSDHITQLIRSSWRTKIQEKIGWFSNYEKFISFERNYTCTLYYSYKVYINKEFSVAICPMQKKTQLFMEISVHIIILSILLPNSNYIVASSLITLLSLFLLCEYMQLYSIFQNK